MIVYGVVHMLGRGPRDKKDPKLKTCSIFCARVAPWGDKALAFMVLQFWPLICGDAAFVQSLC